MKLREDDFSDFVAARWARMVRSVVALGFGREDAQDVVQASLLKCYVNWNRVSRARDLDSYVYKVLLNTMQDRRRRRSWYELPSATMPEETIRHEDADFGAVDAVHRLLANLPDGQRVVVVLRVLNDFSESQTSELLGIAPGTVKSRLSRALQALARDVDQNGAFDGSGNDYRTE